MIQTLGDNGAQFLTVLSFDRLNDVKLVQYVHSNCNGRSCVKNENSALKREVLPGQNWLNTSLNQCACQILGFGEVARCKTLDSNKTLPTELTYHIGELLLVICDRLGYHSQSMSENAV